MTIDATLLTVIGSVLVAALGLAGVIYAARSSRAANARTLETQSWQAQLDALQKRADSWRDDVEALRADRDEDRRQHADEIAAVRNDLEKVKEEAAADRLARNELLRWARAVYLILRRNELDYPQPLPPGVSDTDTQLTPL